MARRTSPGNDRASTQFELSLPVTAGGGVEPTSVEFHRLQNVLALEAGAFAARLGRPIDEVVAWESGVTAPPAEVTARVRELVRDEARAGRLERGFTFIDLFAGIGGIRRAFERFGGRCLFTSEWDRFSRKTYSANFGIPEEEIFGDIRAPEALERIPEHDVLLAGFPCQPFSIAGVSKKNALGRPHGFACDTQGTLFFEIQKILERHRPRAFLLENVRNLERHDSGNTFGVIHHALTKVLGYRVFHRVLDARGVLPQHRERIFIVGFRDPVPWVTENEFWRELQLPTADRGPRLDRILHPGDPRRESPEPRYTDSNGRALPKYTLTRHLWRYLRDYAAKHRARGNGFGYGLVRPDDVARTLSARYYKDGSEILIRDRQGRRPRRLTPRECARLMGFDPLLGDIPLPPEQRFQIPVSDTQAYRQFGNSVAVPVVETVARLMLPCIIGAPSEEKSDDKREIQPGARRRTA